MPMDSVLHEAETDKTSIMSCLAYELVAQKMAMGKQAVSSSF